MEKQVSKESLEKLPKLSKSVRLSNDNTAYKDCSLFYHSIPNLEERLRFIDSLPNNDGYTKPISLLKDGDEIYGYEMEYLKNYVSLTDFVTSGKSSKLSFEKKKYILLKLYQTLRQLNKDYYVCDIHGKNIMISKKGDAKIIDWENGRPLNINYSVPSIYYIRELHGKCLSDSLRLFYNSLSLLYDVDLEWGLISRRLPDSLSICENLNFDYNIKQYARDIKQLYATKSTDCIYFDDYLKSIKKIPVLEKKRTKQDLQYHCIID